MLWAFGISINFGSYQILIQGYLNEYILEFHLFVEK